MARTRLPKNVILIGNGRGALFTDFTHDMGLREIRQALTRLHNEYRPGGHLKAGIAQADIDRMIELQGSGHGPFLAEEGAQTVFYGERGWEDRYSVSKVDGVLKKNPMAVLFQQGRLPVKVSKGAGLRVIGYVHSLEE